MQIFFFKYLHKILGLLRPLAIDTGFDTEVTFKTILLVLSRHVVAGPSCCHPSGMFVFCCFFFCFVSFLCTSWILVGKED